MTLTEIFDLAKKYDDLNWLYFHVMKPADRDLVEKHLINISHPLAYQAGTQEWRVKEYFRQLQVDREVF